MPQALLSTAVLVFAAIGAYSIKGSVSDILIVFVLGILAFVLRRFKFPIAPVLLGVVLGPMIEQEFRRALSISGGDYSVFVTRPITVVLLLFAFALVFTPMIMARLKAPRLAGDEA